MASSKPEIGTAFRDIGVRLLTTPLKRAPELGTGAALLSTEFARMSVTRPTIGGVFPIPPEEVPNQTNKVEPALITAENTPDFIYESVNHSGDLIDGFAITGAIYYAETLLLKNKLSEKVRLGTAWIASNLVVAGVEAGVLGNQPTDIWDIPAGVVGSTMFLGAHLFSKLKYRKWLEKKAANGEDPFSEALKS